MKGVKLVNLQVMLEAGASELSSGKLVHCHAFNFSRAMSALVILNSKQDAGVSFLDIRAPDDRLHVRLPGTTAGLFGKHCILAPT